MGVGLAVGGGAVLGVVWAVACPWLIGLSPEAAASLRPDLCACALAVGLASAWLVPRGILGSAGAARVGFGLAGGGFVGALIAALVASREISSAPAVALGLSCLGAAVSIGLSLTVAVHRLDRHRGIASEVDSGGLPLRSMVAGVCGALAIAAWALASGHVLGQRYTDADRHALDEARAVVAIAAERTLLGDRNPVQQIDAIAPQIAPRGGYLVTVDADGKVLGGVGVGVASDSRLSILDGPPTLCRAARRLLPCAVRRLADGSRLVAAVPPSPIGGDVVLAFALVGLLVAGGALGIGGLVGMATARDLERVSTTLDELRRGTKGLPTSLELDRPIVVASLDEVGDLAAALGRLRARLQPMLAEYRRSLEKSQAADRARDEFLTLVSVELRSPLDEIIAAARLMLDEKDDPLSTEQRDDVNTVLSASNNLTELIDEVLDVSAIASGQIRLRLGSVDVGQLVADVAKGQRPIVQGKGVDVRLDVDTPSPRVRGDERRLRQVITNIISNAVKFTDHGSIELSVKQSAATVEVRVRDTGPGIAADALPKLFREFVQLGSLRQRAHGTGLGLAICKRLVEAHEGQVSAESTVGVGSTFSVRLPVGGPAASPILGDDTPLQAIG